MGYIYFEANRLIHFPQIALKDYDFKSSDQII